MTDFISLQNQTSYSLLDSLIEPKALLKRAKELGQTAIAITDHGTLAATWDAWKASKETGVKLIIGCECYFTNDTSNIDEKFRHVVLIAKNAVGYRNLLTLNKKGFDQNSFIGKRVYSVIDWKLLEQYAEGLICLTACGNGIVSQLLMNHKMDEAEQTLLRLQNIFGDNLGLEVQPNNMKRGSNIYNDEIDQNFLNRQLILLGKKLGIRVVAACNAHYLRKEDHDTHDVFLAIGSHQPVYSNYRLKYPVPDFYLKTGDEIKTFFTRNYGEETAQSLCDNSLYFANLCEVPQWIDPKFSNPTGKELPVFPVKDEVDYLEFVEWVSRQVPDLQKLEEDKLFLRYRCEKLFDSRVKNLTSEQRAQYFSRIDEELDVLEYHGFSSYMLIVADFIEWARHQEIAVGEGRGCLTGKTKVLTANGFKRLDTIQIDDEVYSHTGKLRKVVNTFKFDVSEEKLLRIKTNHSFDDIILTADHEVYAAKTEETDQYKRLSKIKSKSFLNGKLKRWKAPPKPQWLEVCDLKKNNLIYTTFPIREKSELDIPTQFILEYSSTSNSSLDKETTILVDNNFMYLLGRFVGDGWIRSPNNIDYDAYCIGIAFHSNDIEGIDRIFNYFYDLGLNPRKYKHKKKDLVQLMVHNKSLVNIFKSFFPDYKNTSNTKHLPYFFRHMSDAYLKQLVSGVLDSDGFKKEKSKSGNVNNRNSIDSTSRRLILELKELLLFLKTKSSIVSRKEFMRGEYKCKKSYKLRFSRKDFNNNSGTGYYSKITKITEVHDKYVYDITVDEDHSYLTSNYIVHNSVGGSLIAFILGIHQADPIKYNLIFARFHNKEKSSFPDIDTDFAPSGREKVQNYLRQKYGEDNVAHVSNVNTITPKVYVKDIARACELGGSRDEALKIGNEVADCIPTEIHNIDDALEKVPLFAEYCKKYPQFIQYKEICGKYRAWSTHAGGIIISARPLTGLVPLRKDKDGVLAIEYDKDKAEENGLVKMDTLGLSTLDIIGQAMQLIKAAGKPMPPAVLDYEEHDELTYKTISDGDTFCVFQLGTSGGTIDLCRRIKPNSINDISYVNSLARPSARDMRNDFILTKDGKKPFALLHPTLGRAFNNTFGFGLYEESLMYLAQDVAGWSLHSADRLRKLTKEKGKNPKKAQAWRSEFVRDAVKNNVSEAIAQRIWDEVVDKFQGYGFNMSHSILYSMTSYKTAYLKAHYPIEFLLANLMAEVGSNAPDARANIEKIKKELRKHKVKIFPPDVNKSKLVYTIEDENKLITGLDAIKFVGDDAIKDIIAKRPFKNFFDFMVRISSKAVRANSIQALAACGALDSFHIPRKLMFLYCSDYRKKLQVWSKKHDPTQETFIYPWPQTSDDEWSVPELYALEQYYLGESFVCKPAVAYGDFFKDEHKTVADIRKAKDKTNMSSFKGIVRSFFEFRVKKETSKYYGKAMIKAALEDKHGDQVTCTIFPDRWENVQERIKQINKKAEFGVGIALHFAGNTNSYEDDMGIILDTLFNIAIPPSVPADLKAKKLNLKKIKLEAREEQKLEKYNDPEELFQQIEDDLYDQGLIDLDAEEQND